jgi:hypothetical protein
LELSLVFTKVHNHHEDRVEGVAHLVRDASVDHLDHPFLVVEEPDFDLKGNLGQFDYFKLLIKDVNRLNLYFVELLAVQEVLVQVPSWIARTMHQTKYVVAFMREAFHEIG